MAALRVGPGVDDDTQVGPLVNDDAVDKVDELVRGAVAAGAAAVVGGAPSRPRRRLLLRADRAARRAAGLGDPRARRSSARSRRSSTFDDEDEAIRLANDTEYGLVSYVYTGDLARGLRVSEALESGMVGLNRGLVSDPAAPFGGTKQSGIGREGGHEGMLDYLETKYIAVDW